MVSERSRASGRPLRQPIAPGLRPVKRTSGIAADFVDLGQAMPGLLVQNLGQVIYLLTCPSVVVRTVILLRRRRSADDGSVATYSLGNHCRRRREPQLIHGDQPDEGEASAHQCAGEQHDPGEWVKQLGEID